jgi:hypothetical protein
MPGAWRLHPRRSFVESSSDSLDKAARTLQLLGDELPECCRRHVIPALRHRQTMQPSTGPQPFRS